MTYCILADPRAQSLPAVALYTCIRAVFLLWPMYFVILFVGSKDTIIPPSLMRSIVTFVITSMRSPCLISNVPV